MSNVLDQLFKEEVISDLNPLFKNNPTLTKEQKVTLSLMMNSIVYYNVLKVMIQHNIHNNK